MRQPDQSTQVGTLAVEVQNVTKNYGTFTALKDINLGIKDNEFFTMLGPSGCGKTTLLRSIAGFESISKGDLLLYGENIADLPPNKRPVNTVFQQYALFPHMNVTSNVMFGLERLGHSATDAKRRAREVLAMVQLTQFADRLPSQLSGGQQQRVALARALAPNPKVLLLDEPLSALDLKLRQSVRVELQQLQHETGITFVFVTHDQEEALTMSDRIAVMSNGQVQQVGTPVEIYEHPVNRFVADFIGDTNIIDVTVTKTTGQSATCRLPDGSTLLCEANDGAAEGTGHISIRPERIRLCNPGTGQLDGRIKSRVYLGTDLNVHVTLKDGTDVKARIQNTDGIDIPNVGEPVDLRLEASGTRLLVD